MKKLFAVVLCLTIATPAFAADTIVGRDPVTQGLVGPVEVFRPNGTTDTYALRSTSKGMILYNSGTVAAGAVISSPTLDVSGIREITCWINNTAGAVARITNVKVYADDGTTLLFAAQARSIAAAASEWLVLGTGAVGNGSAVIPFPITIPRYVAFNIPAAGAAACSLMCWGR
jgi:hypothetical protein